MRLPRLALLVGIGFAAAGLAACADSATPEPPATPTAATSSPEPSPEPSPERATLDGESRTEPIDARSYRLGLGDLSEPFATESARKGPDVIGVPPNPVLRVPPGFRVNVWAAP